ncbi:MAG: AAA family ATPase [Clostridia bacterium]|nr:AAA family ATPase [Clostridia bacterium]
MNNKQILEQTFRSCNENAKRYLDQNNLSAAREYFKKALATAIKLIESSFGPDKTKYAREAQVVASMIERINEKYAIAEEEAKQKKQEANNKKASAKSGNKEDEKPKEKLSLEESIGKLNELIGLNEVKVEVGKLTNKMRSNMLRKQQGLPVVEGSKHLIFKGNPGTGKTTVARIMADIYYSLGIIEKGQLVEVSRADVVAGYVGQTAIKMQEKIDQAMGGVLFIDEAYDLARGGENDFGIEAINTLLVALENHRDDFVVIVAGYDAPMDKFIESNEGLSSRFKTQIHFTDYNGADMLRIFKSLCDKNKYVVGEESYRVLGNYFDNLYANRQKDFANARTVRKFFEAMVEKQSDRIVSIASPTKEELMTILPQDLPV